jgi:hypothetical protein
MAERPKDKPKDIKPATEYGEVKVIKNDWEKVDPGKTPGTPEGGPEIERDKAGKTPGKSEG